MIFDDIHYLWFLLVVPLFLYLSINSYKKSDRWLYSFAREKKKFGKNLLNIIFLPLSIIGVVLSMANPKIQYERTYFNRTGIEICISIDVSKSMLAEDVNFPLEGRKLFGVYDRLNRARYFALDMLSRFQGERVGFYIFASKGVEIIPFTRDYNYCRYILKHIGVTDITIPGSDLGEAINTGITMLEGSNNGVVKIIVLISDGEDISLDKSSISESAKVATDKEIRIYTIGIGMEKAVLIPVRSEDGSSIEDYFIDEEGSYLKTRLVQDTLKGIATLTGGQYFRIRGEESAEELMKAVLNDAETVELTKSVELAWRNLSPFFLGAGLIFFIIAILVGRR